MGLTTIVRVINRSSVDIAVLDLEDDRALGHGVSVRRDDNTALRMYVPWATSAGQFPRKHLHVRMAGRTGFRIWQAAHQDGDHVRFSADDRWHLRGEPVDGVSGTGGDRTLVVFDDGVQLLDIPQSLINDIRGLLPARRFRLTGSVERSIGGTPRRSAVAFSVAGRPSDEERINYRDSGKRWDFTLDDNGQVRASHRGVPQLHLEQAISYDRRRVGERMPAPPFELIAASGGRVFAKERGRDFFYFATMDEPFMHETASRGVFPVPSTYFKLDPEHHRSSARPADLQRPLEGWFGHHPMAERFPLMSAILRRQATDIMPVRVEKRVWHRLDSRPAAGTLDLNRAMIDLAFRALMPLVALAPGSAATILPMLATLRARVDPPASVATGSAPPLLIPTYSHVTYADTLNGTTISMPSIDYRHVLDIGVGHVHVHEQYERVTGGELQPILQKPGSAEFYQFFNGPVQDGDGYIDGTCTYYALVELASRRFALLYQDEQTYFTNRWRMVDPLDNRGLLFAIIAELGEPAYDFDPTRYWCPFRTGRIGARSRLAVAAQVLLVTGDADTTSRRRIYSINFSWSTMDRTWRARELPADPEFLTDAEVAAGDEPVAVVGRDSVYPQTIRLREDMTMHLRGARLRSDGTTETGRWYQRYLPASNRMPAPPVAPTGGDPSIAFRHPWKFLRDQLWELADQFSHIGVYGAVDSRCQFYRLEVDEDDEDVLSETAGPWRDEEFALTRSAPKFTWAAPLHLSDPTRHPLSMYNRRTRLRVVKRRGRWIAMHWDKRDDDLLPFDGLPKEVLLANAGRRVRVTFRRHVRVKEPPAIRRVEFRWNGRAGAPATLTVLRVAGRSIANLWAIRMAALLPRRQELHVFSARLLNQIGTTESFRVRFRPDQDQADRMREPTTIDGADQAGTAIWFEDVVGHVAPAEEPVTWVRTP